MYARPSRRERERRLRRAEGLVRRLVGEGAEASPEALATLQRAVARGNVRNPKDYLRRIVRFQTTGEWVVTILDPAPREPSPHPVGGGRIPRWNGGPVVRSRSYD